MSYNVQNFHKFYDPVRQEIVVYIKEDKTRTSDASEKQNAVFISTEGYSVKSVAIYIN